MDPTTFDPTGLFDGTTSIDTGGQVLSPDLNPSNGISSSDLFGQLLGTAGAAYTANQASAASIAAAQAQAAALSQPGLGNPLAIFSGSGRQWLIIGAGLLALALILRR